MNLSRSVLSVATLALFHGAACAAIWAPLNPPHSGNPDPVIDWAEVELHLKTVAGHTNGSSGDDVQGYAPAVEFWSNTTSAHFARSLGSFADVEYEDVYGRVWKAKSDVWGSIVTGV